MKYVYRIRVAKETGVPDSYTYDVVAASGWEAMAKALRHAQKDSGYERHWNVVNLSKSDTYVIT